MKLSDLCKPGTVSACLGRVHTLGEAFEELRRLCEEEDYTLEIPPRQERPNPFPDALDELSR